jgi:hypothetical protein
MNDRPTLTRRQFLQGTCKAATTYERGRTAGRPNHMVDFFNCVRSRGTPKCPADEAFIETATYLMSVEAYRRNRAARWAAVKEEMFRL